MSDEHCCAEMDFFLAEERVAIIYSSEFREYAIDMRTSSGKQLMRYCPWCGEGLPRPVRDEWFEALDSMLHDFEGFGDPRIPNEFLSSAWWKKREL